MILHIMPKGFIASEFIPFIQDNLSEDNYFILTQEGDSRGGDLSSSSVTYIDNYRGLVKDQMCKKWIRESRAIIVHWVNGAVLTLLLPYSKKVIPLFWGGDLQRIKEDVVSENWKTRAAKKYILWLIERAPHLITLTPGDYDAICKLCNPRGVWHEGIIFSSDLQNITFARPNRVKDKPIRILVGNSATITNRSVEAIKVISKYSDRLVEVYAPLSYGDNLYRDEVIEAGKRIFGNKFIPLTDFVPLEEYTDLLSTMSVGIFNHNRQQGLGNITTLIAQGAKVYLSEEGPLLEDFINKGLKVFPTETIENLSFDEFLEMRDEDIDNNMNKGSMQELSRKAINAWESIFAAVSMS